MKKADSFKFKAMTGLTCSERNPGRAREGVVKHRRVIFLSLMLALLLINGTDLRAQIALRGTATSATTTNNTTLTINKPAGVVAGDVMIVNITYTNPNTYTDASLTGWTLVAGARQSTGTRYSTVLYRVAGGSEGLSFTFTLGAGTSYAVGSIIAFSGVDASVFDVTPGSFSVGGGTTITASGITTVTDNAAVVFLAGAGGTNNFVYSSWSGTNPTFTEVMDFGYTGNVSVGAAWGSRATAGVIGNRTVTVGNYYWAGILIALKPRPPISITTGTITGAPFCVSSGSGASVSVPFTSTGTFTGNTYTAELSSSTGVFPGTNIGTLVSNSNSGTISATIPAGTATGTGYLIRVVSDSPAITGSSSSPIEIINGAVNVTSPAAAGGNTQATLSWTNPSGCFDEIMIVAKEGSAVSLPPSGDGSAYTANPAFGSGTAFDGGFVVYKGSAPPQTVTAFTNGTTYHFTFFTRFGSIWSTGTTVTAVPSLATTGDYRSNAATMNWNTTSGQWQTYNGTTWVNTSTPPTSTNAQKITIQNGHTVTVTAAVTVDQVVVETGGKVTVNNVTMTIADGNGDDFVVNGTVELTGTNGVITPTGNLIFNAGSTYIHNRTTNGGIIPTATWDPSSTCLITGLTSGLGTLAGVTQTFGNVTFNCPRLTSWGGDLPDPQIPVAILGDLTMIASGASGAERDFGFCNGDGATQSLSIGGDLIITGGMYRISYRNNVTHHVAGDIIITGGSLLMNSTETGTGQSGVGIINVNGNVEITSGTLNFGQSGRCDADDNGILNISGNFTHSGGTITEEGGATGDVINFAGTTIQTYTSGGTVANLVNFNVNSGAILYMGTSLLGNGSAGTFTLANGGTLGLGDAAGITASGTTGNIRVSGTRTYNTGANYIYNGTAAQVTGNGLPATVNSLVFNNAGGVTFTSACAVTNDFSITTGTVANLGTSLSHTAGTLTLGGVVQPGCTYGSSTSAAVFKNNTFFAGTGLVTTGACASGMWLGGTSTDWHTTDNWFGGTAPGSATDVIITSAAPNQPVVSASPVAVCNNLTISSGSSMTINPGQALTVNGNLANSGTFTITSDAVNNNGSLIVNGSSAGTVTYNRFMPAGSAWHYVSSPVSLTSSPSGSFYGWNEVAGDWDAGTTATPASGIGYTLQTAGTAVSFTGSVVNSVSPISATSPYSDCGFLGGTALYSGRDYASGRNATTAYGGGGWNLLGNPFTSALNVNGTGGFIAGNIGSFDPNYVAVYIYDGASYTFIGSQISGWEETTAGFGDDNVQVGQGFFLLSHCNASTFSFTPGMQTHDISVPMTKSARTEDSPWPGLLLKVKYGDKENSTLVVYNEKMTADLDPGYDVGQLSNGPDVEIYTSLPIADNGVSFARQALPIANADTIIVPLGIDTEAGGEVTFSATTVPLGSNKFWLEDRKSGKFTDLSTGTYTVTLPAKTYGTGRFFIIASTNTPTGIRQPQTEDTGVRVWTSNEKVIIQGEVSDRAICEVYNVNGKKILRIRLTGGEMNTVNLPYGLKGAFIVRVADGAKVTTRKMALL